MLLDFRVFLDIIILENAYCAIYFEHRQGDILDVVDPMFAEGAHQLVEREMLLRQMRSNQRSIVDQQCGLALDHAPEMAVKPGDLGQKIVQRKQHQRGDDSAEQGIVGPGHGVLHRVAQQQQKREIEGSHLPDFALPGEPDPNQHQNVNHRCPQNDLKQRVPVCEHVAGDSN